jgi:hypothetical protein
MQWFLSQHPRIHIGGQSPNIPWHTFWDWFETLLRQADWSTHANAHVGYDIAHYAGSDSERARNEVKRFFRRYMTGHSPPRPRWGLKWIGMVSEPDAVAQFESLWSDTRWIVCIRDPFRTIESAKNTFMPELDVRDYARAWVSTCHFTRSHDPHRVAVVQIDKLAAASPAERHAAMTRVLQCVGEHWCEPFREFITRWPVVHKVCDDSCRSFRLGDQEKQSIVARIPELAYWMNHLGYPVPAPVDSRYGYRNEQGTRSERVQGVVDRPGFKRATRSDCL